MVGVQERAAVKHYWSGSSQAHATISSDLTDALRKLADQEKATGRTCFHHDARITVAPDVALKIGRSQEGREHTKDCVMWYGMKLDDPILAAYGLPPRIFGFPIHVNEAQPAGTLDLIGPSQIVTIEGIE